MFNIIVKKAITPEELNIVFSIRRKVFVDEQHCPPELEYANEDESTHFLAMCENEPCGAARWRKTENGYKLERFAVLSSFRRKGVGAELVKAVLNDLPDDNSKVYLNAQLSARDFYLPFGFKPVGAEFEEAGIMHQQMILSSSAQS